MIRLILCTSLLTLISCDTFCAEKQQQGHAPGTLYNIAETCERCACDGQGSKFCSKDYACQKEKDAADRRPCMFAANRIPHGSQIQVDCNICQCKNTTMLCTQDICPGVENPKSKVEPPKLGSANTNRCTDDNKNCVYWSKQGLCKTNNVVKKKCSKSCGRCSTPGGAGMAAAAPVQCMDTDDRCVAWYQRGGQDLCSQNGFMKKNCQFSCNICTGKAVPSVKPMVCVDEDSKCLAWSKREGLCESSGYLKKKCRKACNLCPEEKKPEENQTTGERCENDSSDCPAWAKAGHCTSSKYVEKNCRLSCDKKCAPIQPVVKEKKVNAAPAAPAVAEKSEKELTFEEEWRQRLIAEGKLKINTGPEGCTFREGGRVYPWGSSIQGGCGICKCRRRQDDTYYFDCEDC